MSVNLQQEGQGADALQLSFVIPVYNRPSEIQRLLKSMTEQSQAGFEVVIVEDGSTVTCQKIVDEYRSQLAINYIQNPTSLGPGLARNVGVSNTSGNFLVFVDSDCFLPSNYVETITTVLTEQQPDAFGGPDTGHSSFSVLQKAIDYSMTSFLTTGGIRKGRQQFDLFYPKGFNMGMKKNVFGLLGGFVDMRYGEDTELSYRVRKNRYSVRYIAEAFVHHQRRNDIIGFFKQVYNSGKARILISRIHSEALKMLHFLPAIAVIVFLLLLALASWNVLFFLPILAYAVAVLIHATAVSKSLSVGIVSICTSAVQVTGYGLGFFVQFLKARGNG